MESLFSDEKILNIDSKLKVDFIFQHKYKQKLLNGNIIITILHEKSNISNHFTFKFTQNQFRKSVNDFNIYFRTRIVANRIVKIEIFPPKRLARIF